MLAAVRIELAVRRFNSGFEDLFQNSGILSTLLSLYFGNLNLKFGFGALLKGFVIEYGVCCVIY